MVIPEIIKRLTEGKSYTTDDIGMSGSKVLIYDEFVLKTGRYREQDKEMVGMMRWLEGKLPVPKVLVYEQDGEEQYLLMSRVKGKMACDPFYMEQPETLVKILAEGIRMLWQVDISDCPRIRDLDTELKEAEDRIRKGQVSIDDAEPGTFGPDGRFSGPEALLIWLKEHKPESEPVLSHGDYCLPNIFLDEDNVSGFIDLGDCGIADKWRDISLLYRSLKHNFEGYYGGQVYPGFHPDMLYKALELEPDWEKLDYYILLDELF